MISVCKDNPLLQTDFFLQITIFTYQKHFLNP